MSHTTSVSTPDTFDVHRSLRIVREAARRRWWMVLATCLLTVGLVVVYMRVFPPIYRGTAYILVEDEKDVLRNQFYGPWSVFRKGEAIKTEAELIKISPVVTEVVQRLDLKYEDVYHPILRVLTDLWNRSLVGRTYKKVKAFFFPPEKNPWEPSPEEKELAMTVVDMQAGIIVQPVGESTVGEVTVKGPTPRVAEMANSLVEVYLAHRRERHRGEATAAYDALTAQVERAKANLQDAEQTLQNFAEQNGVKFEFDKERADVTILSKQEAEWLKTKATLTQVKARIEEIEKQLATIAQRKVGSTSKIANDLRKKLEERLQGYRVGLVELRQQFQPDAPEIQEAEAKVRSIEKLLANQQDMVVESEQEITNPLWEHLNQEKITLQTNLAELEKAEDEQKRIVEHYQSSLEELPAKQREMLRLSRRLAIADEEYRTLSGKQRQALVSSMTELEGIDSIKLIDRAYPPEKPRIPNPKLYLAIAVVVGLILGVVAAFLADYTDEAIYSPDVMEALMNAPTFAVVTLRTPLRERTR